MNNRPDKKKFSIDLVEKLRNNAIEKIKQKFLPDDKIIKIYLIGSSVKNDFGKYDPPGFRGSMYSDFDFIVFVEDDYIIPDLEKEPAGRPFPDDSLNLAYRLKNFVEDKYDAEIFFIRRGTMENVQIRESAEAKNCEIPFDEDSQWPHIIVYQG